MKKIAFALLIMIFNINIVNGESSAFFNTLEVTNGVMSSKYSKYNDMYTVYLDNDEYNLVFNYELEDEDAAIIIENNDYIIDESEVIVTIISSDELNKKKYYFNVYKYNDKEVSFNNNEKLTPLEIKNKKFYHIESVVAIIAFLLILFVFYKLFLT